MDGKKDLYDTTDVDMWYMQEIEQEVLDLDFEHQSKKEFEVFFVNSEIDEDEENED